MREVVFILNRIPMHTRLFVLYPYLRRRIFDTGYIITKSLTPRLFVFVLHTVPCFEMAGVGISWIEPDVHQTICVVPIFELAGVGISWIEPDVHQTICVVPIFEMAGVGISWIEPDVHQTICVVPIFELAEVGYILTKTLTPRFFLGGG